MSSHFVMFGILVLAVCLTQFASDIYSPSLPAIAESLGTSNDMIQWSMSVYMFSASTSQLVYGPISDGYGRKKPLVFGLAIMFLGTIICLFVNSIEQLLLGRFIQGLGAGACAALWRSIFRDKYSGEDLAKFSSYLVIFMMFILPSAPVLGGYLQTFYGWRANFVFMLGYGAIAILGIIFFFSETNKEICPSKVTVSTTKSNYLELLKSPIFMGTAFSVFLSYGTLFSWFVVGPILVIDILNFSPEEFGWMTFCSAFFAYTACACINSRYVKRFGLSNMLRFGWSFMILAGFMMFFGWLTHGINIWWIAGPMFVFYFGTTFIWPNAFAVAFTPFGHIAGYARALYGFMQVGGASALSGVVAYLPDDNQSIFALIIIIASSSAWALYEVVNKINKRQVVSQR